MSIKKIIIIEIGLIFSFIIGITMAVGNFYIASNIVLGISILLFLPFSIYVIEKLIKAFNIYQLILLFFLISLAMGAIDALANQIALLF